MLSKKVRSYALLAALAVPAILTPVIAYIARPSRIEENLYTSHQLEEGVILDPNEAEKLYQEITHPHGLLALSSEAQVQAGLKLLKQYAQSGNTQRAEALAATLQQKGVRTSELDELTQQAEWVSNIEYSIACMQASMFSQEVAEKFYKTMRQVNNYRGTHPGSGLGSAVDKAKRMWGITCGRHPIAKDTRKGIEGM